MNRQCTDPETGRLLHAYELGVLAAGEIRRFEAHLLECEYCFEQAEIFQERAFFLHSGRLVRREIKSLVTSSDTASPVRRLWKRLWPDGPLFLRPALLLLISLALLYPAYRGLMPSVDDAVRPVQSISLMPNRSASTGILSASDDRDGLVSFVVPDADLTRSYRLELASTGGDVLISDPSFSGFDQYRIARLLIPARAMKSGEYRLTISDPEGDTVIPSATFNFVIED